MIPCPICGCAASRPLFEKEGLPYERCADCGLVSRGGPEGPPSYHDYLPEATTALPELTRRRYVELLSALTPFRGEGRFLDVGCGGGFLVEVAAAEGWRAQGTEVSAAAVRFGRSRGLEIHLGTLDDAALPAGAFDVVTLMEVLEHVPHPVDLLRRCRELLRPGGALYLTTPNWGSLSRRLMGKAWFPISAEHVVYPTAGTLRRALCDAGLEPVRVTSANIQPHEILAHFRGGRRGGGDAPARRDWAETERLRSSLESSPLLRAAKACVNACLSLTGTGDTLRATAVRRRIDDLS